MREREDLGKGMNVEKIYKFFVDQRNYKYNVKSQGKDWFCKKLVINRKGKMQENSIKSELCSIGTEGKATKMKNGRKMDAVD